MNKYKYLKIANELTSMSCLDNKSSTISMLPIATASCNGVLLIIHKMLLKIN